ncbi:MAG: Smr/MutS family protein [Pseudomonadota bacterium]|nr:Smr/MutS family protein [Pseudomonadota bacterium]
MSAKKFEVPDKSLWDDVRASVVPIKQGRKVKIAGKLAPLPLAKISTPSVLQNYVPRPSTSPPPLASFDRRTAQKLGRGKVEPEARLDLHGTGLEDARFALLQFLASRRAQGIRMVLVITGKGASHFAQHTLHGVSHFHSPERQGKLRREVPRWLEEAQFRIHVVGFQPAHPRHGGGGAYYVRLRKHGG